MSLAMKNARLSTRSAEPVGDPGLFGGIIGAIKGGVGSLLTGGNPIAGAISGGIRGFRDEPEQRRPPPPPPPPRRPQFRGPPRGVQVNPPFGGRPGMGVRVRPGRGSGFDVGVGQRFGPPVPAAAAPVQQGMQVACPPGFRPNKSDYFLRDGTFVAKGTRCVKIRRRNSLNPRALDRAISRVSGAKRAAKKLGRISIRKKC